MQCQQQLLREEDGQAHLEGVCKQSNSDLYPCVGARHETISLTAFNTVVTFWHAQGPACRSSLHMNDDIRLNPTARQMIGSLFLL